MNLRPYQQQALNAVLSGFREYSKQLCVLPTGGGKTVLFSHLADATEGRTLVLAHREELVDQAIDKIHKVTGIKAGKEKAEFKATHEHEVVVASVQSMIRRLDRWPDDHFDLIVCDEAHHSISKSWRTVLSHFDLWANVLGVTATPDRGDKRNLGCYYENVAFEVSMFDLIKQGFLSQIVIKTCPLKLDISGVKQKAGDYDAGQLGESLDPYLREIARSIKEHASERRSVVFMPLIATSQKFVAICKEEGLRAEHVDGYSVDRKEKLERFAACEFDILSNAMLLTEGWDDPGVDCVVNLRPTKSRSLYSQIIGRGTRIAPDKKNLLLLDFLWMHERHNLVRPAHLVAESEEIAEEMTKISEKAGGQGELELEGLANDAQLAREEKIREMIKEREHEESKLIDAVTFCEQLGNTEAAEFEPSKPWMKKPPTPKQVELLKKEGINLKTVKGKGHAMRIIDAIFTHKNSQPASPKQIAAMKRAGVENAATATIGEAKEFFARRNAQRQQSEYA